MSRDIKFRWWDKEESEMLECIRLDLPNKTEHETVSAMQYTGLKDVNGVEIYEGDVIEGNLIKYSPLPTMGEIVFDEHWASFANKNEAGITLLREINKTKVIGNIHENPELLGN